MLAILWLLASVSQATGWVLRGGSFNNEMQNAAASYRNNNNPNNDNNNNGFRVVLSRHTWLTPQKASVCSQKWLLLTGGACGEGSQIAPVGLVCTRPGLHGDSGLRQAHIKTWAQPGCAPAVPVPAPLSSHSTFSLALAYNFPLTSVARQF